MKALLQSVAALRAVPSAPWRGAVRRVAVVLTSSRSGSSLFKNVLAGHPAIASLDGEAEPFLALSGNGFGFNSDSDALRSLNDIETLADNIFDGLTVADAHWAPLPELTARWSRRLLLQFPALFSAQEEYQRMLRALDEVLGHACARARAAPEPLDEQEVQRQVLAALFWREPWRVDYYDGHLGPGANKYFNEGAKIEEPPFVLPRLRRRRFAAADAQDKILLFKTPSDAYRPGLYEQLFPRAAVRYIHLTRGYAQCVNGLMDGWLSPTGFFAHDLRRAGVSLDIAGYSDQLPFGRHWWKFDLPPDWHALSACSLEEVCLAQWLASHRAIIASGVPALRLAFEDFMADPAAIMGRATRWLELPPLPLPPVLPVTMATETPGAGRWRKRRPQLRELAARPEVASLMDELGYRMEAEDWQ
ncbi:hypothetical protein MJ904_10095 [Massilia sp. MB5]|uniref:hypothetical protein n=1 Tax=Massilia sp. MB5 TaxID=2919578 RepID=UPI001F0DEC9C|nr:hypothetical protein [Massilia sp. MB5]UMR32490.1 hypothetical protein MJ904_10095 [Massilia sp. MB5]